MAEVWIQPPNDEACLFGVWGAEFVTAVILHATARGRQLGAGNLLGILEREGKITISAGGEKNE